MKDDAAETIARLLTDLSEQVGDARRAIIRVEHQLDKIYVAIKPPVPMPMPAQELGT